MLEALVAGGAEGLVLVRDSAACEGRSLLRAFASAAVQRAERVLVVLFDVPQEQFEAGLSPSVKQRLLYRDGFTDPLGWSGPDPDLRAGDFGGLLGGLPPGGPLTLVLDSLSWLLLRLPPPRLCQALGALLGGPPSSGRELHPPARRLPALPGGAPPRAGGGGGGGGGGGEAPRGFGGRAPLTFRLRLSAAERAARAAVPPPYQLSPPRRSALLRTPGTIICAPEPPRTRIPRTPTTTWTCDTTPPPRDIVGPTVTL
ncbi:elongator complex protein 5 isoform X2 [Ciconia boyciana]|uniref:elongator complex protein 5 isoform X2 n=1 Tax=Ciconia boyciana TaxID=52775 RepID=UPI003BA1B081